MALSEATLRKGFVEELKRREQLEVTRIEDTLSSGLPDICVSGVHMWIETKVAKNGRVKSKGIQRLTLRRLGRVSPAYMLIWDEERKLTTLAHPKHIPQQGPIIVPNVASIDATWIGADHLSCFPYHRQVVNYLMLKHSSLPEIR